jgi:hypothetical protein
MGREQSGNQSREFALFEVDEHDRGIALRRVRPTVFMDGRLSFRFREFTQSADEGFQGGIPGARQVLAK